MISCNPTKVKEEIPFTALDYSYFVGQYESMIICNTGQILILQSNQWTGGEKKYSCLLDFAKQDTLLKLIKELLSLKIDSILIEPIADHPASISFVIKSKESTHYYSYFGDMHDNTYSSVFKLSDYLNNLRKTLIEKSDSDFVFDSKSRLINAPQTPPEK
jgi:hypothetical protein